MKHYLVTWEIELEAPTAEMAALEALRIHRDAESTATVFDVIEFDSDGGAVRVDLLELPLCGMLIEG